MSPRYSKKDYEMVAAILNDELQAAGINTSALRYTIGLAAHFAVVFAEDNERFDRERFLAACGVLQDKGRSNTTTRKPEGAPSGVRA